jgi:hypothetical protein
MARLLRIEDAADSRNGLGRGDTGWFVENDPTVNGITLFFLRHSGPPLSLSRKRSEMFWVPYRCAA